VGWEVRIPDSPGLGPTSYVFRPRIIPEVIALLIPSLLVIIMMCLLEVERVSDREIRPMKKNPLGFLSYRLEIG
jgi:hypothetical protein